MWYVVLGVLIWTLAVRVSTAAKLGMDTVIKDYHGREFLDGKQEYLLEWIVDWRNRNLLFNITVRTTGWVGLGFSKNGLMKDADLVIAGDTAEKRPYVTDFHTDCHRNIIADNEQNWNLLGVAEVQGVTTVQISRLIDTCDSEDYPITEDLVYLLWAFGETDKVDYHHQHRGSYKLYLLDPVVHPAPSSASLPKWRVTNTNFTIPAQGTSYWCSIHKGPPTNRKHHLIQFRAVLENPHQVAKAHVHHFVLWRCFAPPGVNPRSIFEKLVAYRGEECYFNDHNIIPINLCRTMTFVWALGARPLILPDHVGIPFAESRDEYYMLEVHYDNPEAVGGITFTAGLEAVYTDRLRPKDGGAFMVDYELFALFMIPPGTLEFKLYSHCNEKCTNTMFPKGGVEVFAIHTHTHKSGRRVKLHHFRNGKELPWLIKDDNYDYLFQNPRPLLVDRKILPGDQMTAECNYDNTWTNVTTFAGPRGVDEMCLFVLYHTVPIPYSWCSGTIPEDRLMRFVGVRNTTWDLPTQERVVTNTPTLNGDKLAHVTDDLIDWTENLRNDLAAATISLPQAIECPVTIPTSNSPPDEATMGYSKQMLMGTYAPPSVTPLSRNMARYPKVQSEFARVRECPSSQQAAIG